MTKDAYVDTSLMVAIAFDEARAKSLSIKLKKFRYLFSSNLLAAEFSSVCVRETVPFSLAQPLLSTLRWILPNRDITDEITRVSSYGYVRGADLWHLATALFHSPTPHELSFLTLDKQQLEIAIRLGFKSPTL